MKFVISPSKTQDYSQDFPDISLESSVVFPEQTQELVSVLKGYDSSAIQSLMKVSEKIADLNVGRFTSFSKEYDHHNSLPAIFAYKGDVYDGFDIGSLDSSLYDSLQSRMRILSGLYGVMRPFDLMQAYRLEMGTRLVVGSHSHLYSYWGTAIADFLEAEEKDVLVNLASEEYWKSVDQSHISSRIVHVVFKEKKGDDYKVIGIHAKKARGMMARFIVENCIDDVDSLKEFNMASYSFSSKMSDENTFVFIR